MKKSFLTRQELPHNFFAEKMVLSCLLLEPSLIESIPKHLPVDAFYFKNHQELYKVLLYMNKNKLSIDILFLMSFLQSKGLLEKVGGTKVIIDLTNQIPTLFYFEDYVKLVSEKFLRRSLIKMSSRIIEASYIGNISIETLLKNMEAELIWLTNCRRPGSFSNNIDALQTIFCDLKEKFLDPKLSGLCSGFMHLDLITQGFQKSDLIILAGRPSMGKTALSLTIALNVLKHARLPILLFSLEMSKEQILYRLLSMETQISAQKLRTGYLNESDWIKLTKIIKLLAKLPFFIDDSSNLSSQDIQLKLKTILLQQEPPGLIIIDYLQLMHDSEKNTKNRTEELSKITRNLKNIAREYNIPIIALSQLSRNVENRPKQRPVLSDLRESGSIEQDADLVLMLTQKELLNTKVPESTAVKEIDLIIAKHRNGPVGIVSLEFDKKYTKFLNKDISNAQNQT